MEQPNSPNAWLLLAAGDDRGHGGNAGYDDQADAYYSWDSNVPNHTNLAEGDRVVVWDKKRLLGTSVIEEIDTEPGHKVLSRCPKCNTTRINERTTVAPRFRCMKCAHEFTAPRVETVEVTTYKARYDAAWTPLDGALEDVDARALAKNRGEFNAMRRLNWAMFREVLLSHGATRALDRIEMRSPDWVRSPGPNVEFVLPQGFSQSLVRVRRGQRQFRARLLERQGSVCAFTGGAPARVLEAGHLYSYARLGEHYEHGGLMLRRDIHRLFDDGLLAVEPSRLRVDVAPDLAKYAQYAKLHDQHLQSTLLDQQVEWLSKHWDEHRSTT